MMVTGPTGSGKSKAVYAPVGQALADLHSACGYSLLRNRNLPETFQFHRQGNEAGKNIGHFLPFETEIRLANVNEHNVNE